MGDRRYCTLILGGHIETQEELNVLLQAMVDEGWAKDLHDAATELADAVDNSKTFEDEERNYGEYDHLERALMKIPALGASANIGTGDDAAFIRTWMPGEFDGRGTRIARYGTCDEEFGPTIHLRSLIEAKLKGGVETLIEEALTACGRKMPELTVSPVVMALLRIKPPQESEAA